MNSLNWKTIVITGWSEWLGKSIAIKLKALWAHVIILARNEAKMKALQDGHGISYHVCDLRNIDIVQQVFKHIIETTGIDILINNSWIRHEWETENCDPQKLKDLLQVNTQWPILCTQQVIPHMKTKKEWQILNVVSIAWLDKCPERSIYAASKAAITQFTNSTQQELQAFWIKVMWIYPWGMDTQIFETAWTYQWVADRMMNKEHVADIIIYMLSQPKDVIMNNVEVRKFG